MSAHAVWPALLAVAALLLWPPDRSLAVRRRRALLPAGVAAGESGARPDRRPGSVPGVVRRWVLAGAAGLACALLVGGGVGVVAAVGVAFGGERLLRRTGPDQAGEFRAALGRELPGACDLMAVCLAAGVPVGGALAAVGEAVPAPLGAHLRGVAALYRLGAEPRRAWSDVPTELGALGRVMVRAGESGSAAVPALRALAADGRTSARAATEAGARRAGVWVLAPLGVCFLPAFLCLGVVPLVLGIAADVFG